MGGDPYGELSDLMGRFRVDDLVAVAPDAFRHRLESWVGRDDHEQEGLDSPEGQRDLTVRFHWGHDHDFGDFQMVGRMGDRHLSIPARFIGQGALPLDLTNRTVLDVGCWTGGTSLLLTAMGADVVAIEEVTKYAECVRYLAESFGVADLDVHNLSLFETAHRPDFQDRFDYALYSGVLYHVTDPVLSLRAVFNSLSDGGVCLLETMTTDSEESVCQYLGPTWLTGGANESGSRGGWNWFVPSPLAISQMMTDVGFEDVWVSEVENGRAFATGVRRAHVPILRAGLADRAIR